MYKQFTMSANGFSRCQSHNRFMDTSRVLNLLSISSSYHLLNTFPCFLSWLHLLIHNYARFLLFRTYFFPNKTQSCVSYPQYDIDTPSSETSYFSLWSLNFSYMSKFDFLHLASSWVQSASTYGTAQPRKLKLHIRRIPKEHKDKSFARTFR
jgi:hypothetical protein